MSEYGYLFTPFWKIFDVVLLLLGLWFAWQPSALLEPFGAITFSRNHTAKLGLPPALTARLISITRQREDLSYQLPALRLIGVAFVAAGIIGIPTPIDEPTLVSALAVLTVAALAFVLLNAKRKSSVHAALLDGTSPRAVPWSIVAVLVVEAVAEASVGNREAVTVAAATIISAGLITLLAKLPVILSGEDVVLERQVDRRYRIAQVAICSVWSQVPSLVWAGSVDTFRLSATVARVIISASLLCIAIFLFAAVRRSDDDLKQAANFLR
jgi:uncharacterized membrane protein